MNRENVIGLKVFKKGLPTVAPCHATNPLASTFDTVLHLDHDYGTRRQRASSFDAKHAGVKLVLMLDLESNS